MIDLDVWYVLGWLGLISSDSRLIWGDSDLIWNGFELIWYDSELIWNWCERGYKWWNMVNLAKRSKLVEWENGTN